MCVLRPPSSDVRWHDTCARLENVTNYGVVEGYLETDAITASTNLHVRVLDSSDVIVVVERTEHRAKKRVKTRKTGNGRYYDMIVERLSQTSSPSPILS